MHYYYILGMRKLTTLFVAQRPVFLIKVTINRAVVHRMRESTFVIFLRKNYVQNVAILQ